MEDSRRAGAAGDRGGGAGANGDEVGGVMKQEPLSERRMVMLRAIKSYTDQKHYAPSVRDLRALCGISSTSVVAYHLFHLDIHGYINREEGISRAMYVTDKGKKALRA
jgi:SOS-response transcriptional repressor LexA